jgi:hypothetical protein
MAVDQDGWRLFFSAITFGEDDRVAGGWKNLYLFHTNGRKLLRHPPGSFFDILLVVWVGRDGRDPDNLGERIEKVISMGRRIFQRCVAAIRQRETPWKRMGSLYAIFSFPGRIYAKFAENLLCLC